MEVHSQRSFLVILMLVMAVLAVFRIYPPALILDHGNWVVSAAMLIGAIAVLRWRPLSYPVAILCAALTALCGVLATLKVRGFRPVEFPLVWVVIGLYVAFRLSLIHHQTRKQAQKQAEHPTPTGTGTHRTPSDGDNRREPT